MFWKCTGLENSQNQSLWFNRSHWIMEGSIPLIRGNRKINNWEKGCAQYSNFPTCEIQIREEGDLDRQIMGHVDRRSNTSEILEVKRLEVSNLSKSRKMKSRLDHRHWSKERYRSWIYHHRDLGYRENGGETPKVTNHEIPTWSQPLIKGEIWTIDLFWGKEISRF